MYQVSHMHKFQIRPKKEVYKVQNALGCCHLTNCRCTNYLTAGCRRSIGETDFNFAVRLTVFENALFSQLSNSDVIEVLVDFCQA